MNYQGKAKSVQDLAGAPAYNEDRCYKPQKQAPSDKAGTVNTPEL